MRKSIFLAVLGLVTSVAPSYGDGHVWFSSYIANNGLGAITSQYEGGSPIGLPYQADLYYSLGAVSDPVNFGSASSIMSLPTGMTDLGTFVTYDNSGSATGVDGLGYFDGPLVTIPGYTNGFITFEVVAFNGVSYATSSSRGRSGSFTMEFIANSVMVPPSLLGDNESPMPNFVVVPEPATTALVGLGGLASLMMFRRHQS